MVLVFYDQRKKAHKKQGGQRHHATEFSWMVQAIDTNYDLGAILYRYKESMSQPTASFSRLEMNNLSIKMIKEHVPVSLPVRLLTQVRLVNIDTLVVVTGP